LKVYYARYDDKARKWIHVSATALVIIAHCVEATSASYAQTQCFRSSTSTLSFKDRSLPPSLSRSLSLSLCVCVCTYIISPYQLCEFSKKIACSLFHENFRSKNAKPIEKIMKYFSCRISSTTDSNSFKNTLKCQQTIRVYNGAEFLRKLCHE